MMATDPAPAQPDDVKARLKALRRRLVGMGWGHYKTTASGIRHNAALLASYPSKHHADTLASIIPIWNGHGANDPRYISRVSRWSGISPNAPLDMRDPRTMAKLISAMSREEGTDPVTIKEAAAALMAPHKPGVHMADANTGLPDNVSRLIKALRTRQPVKPAQVHITNSTSARVAVSVNAVAN